MKKFALRNLTLLALVAVIVTVCTSITTKAANPWGPETIEERAQELVTLAANYGLISSAELSEFEPSKEASYSFCAKLIYRAEKLRNTGATTMKAPSSNKAMTWLLSQYLEVAMANAEDAYCIISTYLDGKQGFKPSGKCSWHWLSYSCDYARGYGEADEEARNNACLEVRERWAPLRNGERMTRIEALDYVITNLRDDIYIQEMNKKIDDPAPSKGSSLEEELERLGTPLENPEKSTTMVEGTGIAAMMPPAESIEDIGTPICIVGGVTYTGEPVLDVGPAICIIDGVEIVSAP